MICRACENANSNVRRPIDALTKIYRVEGARGFFKGWLAHYMRIGPHTIFTFLFWEQIKKVSAHFGY